MIAERRRDFPFALPRYARFWFGALVVVLGLSLLLVPEGDDPHVQFYREDGLITVISSVWLALAAGFCLSTRMVISETIPDRRWFWTVLAAGFVFLAVDEVFQIHEQLGWILSDYADSGPFRNWNDIIVFGYGIVALILAWRFLPQLQQIGTMPEVFLIGFGFYLAHSFTDALVEDPTVTSIIIEESFKLTCNMFLAMGAMTGLQSELNQTRGA